MASLVAIADSRNADSQVQVQEVSLSHMSHHVEHLVTGLDKVD